MTFADAVKKPLVTSDDIKRAAEEQKAPAREFVSLERAVATAGRQFSAGRIDEAETTCRQVLQKHPNTADAHNILGAILFRRGQTERAISEVREAIRINGRVAAYHANLGEMERKAEHLEAAERALTKAIRLDPNSGQAHNNLGIVYFDQREFEKAAISYRRAIEVNGNYPEAHNNLGNTLRALGRLDEAIASYERALEMRNNYPEAYNNLASVLRDQRKYDQAELSYQRAISLRPTYLEAIENLAGLFITQERYDDALRLLSEILKSQPERVPTLVLVARAQLGRHSYQQADSALKAALKVQPDNIEALVLYGQVSHDLDRFEEAIASYEKALAARANNVEALNLLGIALKSVGRLEDARAALRRAIELQPNIPATYSNIADLEKFTPEHPLLPAMLRFLESDDPAVPERFIALHFALGKAYDDMGDSDKAFGHFAAGAARKRARLDYNETDNAAFFEEIKGVFNRDYFEHRPFAGDPTDLPIFIVGMPRSGSTLTEQILASHPKVFGAGEIKTLTHSLGMIRMRFPNLPKYPAIARAMKPTQFAAIANSYLETVTARAPDAPRITDKLLSNFYFVGLINTLFPRARIIHTMRNPVDTCLSAYTKLFKDEMAHSYELGELGRYYRRYEAMMQHWREHLPAGTMLDIVYEDVVADTEAKAREMIAFCGLEWDDRCLAFHETKRPVKTASVSQVRKPLYGTSVERWRRYGDRLAPLLEALGMDENGVRAA